MKQYLLQTPDGYYWLWWENEDGSPNLSGPFSEKIVNLPVVKTDNPMGFNPKDADTNE